MRRLIVFSMLLVSAFALSTLGSAAGAAEELEEYLQDAADAEYSGSEIVVSYWEEEAIAAIYEVQQSDGMTRVGDGNGQAMAGDGVFEGSTEEGVTHSVVSEWADWRLHERYSLAEPRSTLRLGRAATTISILEEGLVRVRLIIDNATGAALRTQVFDDDGDLYRLAVLLDFNPNPAPVSMDFEPSSEYTVAGADTSGTLPAVAAGYWRADTYSAPDATVHAFYADGLFSFSVFQYEGQAAAGPFSDASKWKVGKDSYRRISDPGAIRLYWNSADATYVLIGDLPPDHLKDVLAELPKPDRRGLFARVWRGIFG